jgi:hypothetical protein
MDDAHVANLSAVQQRSKELEDQLQQAELLKNEVTTKFSEEVQAHRATIEQLEQRIRDMEAGSYASQAALERRSKELEERLQQATLQHEQGAAQASEQVQAHRATTEINTRSETLPIHAASPSNH